MTTTKDIARGFVLAYALVAFVLVGCSSSTPVQETTYVSGPYAGDAPIVANGWVEPTSMLPYGGGNEGIRAAEDEAPPPTGNLGYY